MPDRSIPRGYVNPYVEFSTDLSKYDETKTREVQSDCKNMNIIQNIYNISKNIKNPETKSECSFSRSSFQLHEKPNKRCIWTKLQNKNNSCGKKSTKQHKMHQEAINNFC